MGFKRFYETPSEGIYTDTAGKELYFEVEFNEFKNPNSTLQGTYLSLVMDSYLPSVVYKLSEKNFHQDGLIGRSIHKPQTRRAVAIEICYMQDNFMIRGEEPSELEIEIETHYNKLIKQKKKTKVIKK